MNTQISLQKWLKDLRVECGLSLQELAEQTQISRSALGNYKNDDYKKINHRNLIILADFYDVPVDYLLGRIYIRKHEKTSIKDLNLNDVTMDLFMSDQINNQLLCELMPHEKFTDLMADTEIYVDDILTDLINNLNTALEHIRSEIIEQTPEATADRPMQALEATQIQGKDFFCNATHKS